MLSISERILYEDNHLLIVNKQASEIVQGDKSGDVSLRESVREYIRITHNKPGNVFTGLVHRIDRPVSGAVVFAKTGKSLTRMNQLVKERKFGKTYLAVVKSRPPKPEDTLEHHLLKNEKQNKSYISPSTNKASKAASLTYRLAAASDSFFLLEIELHTGRHHQIRAQLAAIGCPIRGDVKYGYDRPNPNGSIDLHAWKIKFEHPVKKIQLEVVAPTNNHMPWSLFIDELSNL
jgi:23S rRNA pseudouridine1911/1915/1917 synthase